MSEVQILKRLGFNMQVKRLALLQSTNETDFAIG